MKKLPRVIYVKIENEGTDDEFLDSERDVEKHASVGEHVIVGKYVLSETLDVAAGVRLTQLPRSRK